MKYWPLLVLVACGDDGDVRNLPDGPPAAGQVNVVVREGEAPIPGAEVYVQGPDGTLLAATTTDATGRVTLEGVVAGSAVTVQHRSSLRTILDVQSGDELVYASAPDVDYAEVPVQVAASTQPTLHRYLIAISCGGGALEMTTNGTLYVDGCTTADVLVDVQDDNYQTLEFAYAGQRSVSGALDLTALVYTPAPPQTITITNAPGDWSQLDLNRSIATTRGPLHTCDAFGGVLRCPAVPGAIVVDAVYGRDDSVEHTTFIPSTTETTSFDLAGLPIATVPEQPAFDLETHTVQFLGGARANLLVVTLAEDDRSWTVIGRATAGSFAIPRLASALGSFTQAATVEAFTLVNVVGGYPAVRQQAFATNVQGWVMLTGQRVVTASYQGAG